MKFDIKITIAYPNSLEARVTQLLLGFFLRE
jgi:hypothetical protein